MVFEDVFFELLLWCQIGSNFWNTWQIVAQCSNQRDASEARKEIDRRWCRESYITQGAAVLEIVKGMWQHCKKWAASLYQLAKIETKALWVLILHCFTFYKANCFVKEFCHYSRFCIISDRVYKAELCLRQRFPDLISVFASYPIAL